MQKTTNKEGRTRRAANTVSELVGLETGDIHKKWTGAYANLLEPPRVWKKKLGPLYQQNSTCISALTYFTGVIQFLVEQKNLYCQQYLDSHNKGPSLMWQCQLYSCSWLELYTYGVQHRLAEDYWFTLQQLYTPFYNTMKPDRYFHILCFLCFSWQQQKHLTRLVKSMTEYGTGSTYWHAEWLLW